MLDCGKIEPSRLSLAGKFPVSPPDPASRLTLHEHNTYTMWHQGYSVIDILSTLEKHYPYDKNRPREEVTVMYICLIAVAEHARLTSSCIDP